MNQGSVEEYKGGDWMNRLCATITALFLALATVKAQTPQSHGKPTEQVVIRYEKLVADGAFLTPEGGKWPGNFTISRVPFLAKAQSLSCQPEDHLRKLGAR